MEDRINIEDLHEIAESLADELDEYSNLIFNSGHSISTSNYPFTYFALFSFIPKVESLRIAIFNLVEVGEFYSAKILFRAIIEHYLKFLYIWMRHIHEKSDDVGKDYFIFCGAKEELDFAKSLRTRAEVLRTQINIDPVELLKKLDVRLNGESNKSLKDAAGQFSHRNTVAYLSSKLCLNDEKQIPDFLPNIIPAYSELSAFVHGGPSTLRYAEACSNCKIAEQELRSNAAVSLQMSLSVKANTFLLLSRIDKRMFLPFQVVRKALDTRFANLKDT